MRPATSIDRSQKVEPGIGLCRDQLRRVGCLPGDALEIPDDLLITVRLTWWFIVELVSGDRT